MTKARTTGRLWVVATPIGNLGDISGRALEVLREADLIAAEDTRRARRLLDHFGIETPTLSFHEHNENARTAAVLERLHAGDSIALVSDAGTPLISDPGFPLVRAARAEGIAVSTVPGPVAAIAALSVSGLPADHFVFEGFLPARRDARRNHLQTLADEPRTLIFHEASHRVADMLADCAAVLGAERPAFCARELTKVFESLRSGTLAELAAAFAQGSEPSKGEFVIVVGGRSRDTGSVSAEARRVLRLLAAELPPARAAKLAAAITGAPRRELYALLEAEKTAGNQ